MHRRAHLQVKLSEYPTPQLARGAGTNTWVREQWRFNRVAAAQITVCGYQVNGPTAPDPFPHVPELAPLAYHTGEIQCLFPRPVALCAP
jgi:para-nitrobenzyl esterase